MDIASTNANTDRVCMLIGFNGKPKSRQTLARIRNDPELEFPKPFEIHGRLYWREDEVVSWLNARPRITVLQLRGGRRAGA